MVALRDEGQSLRAVAEAMRGKGFRISHMAVREITMRAQAAASQEAR